MAGGCATRRRGAGEGRLIVAVERGEIDSFYGRIELALVIVLAVGECCRCLFGGDDVAAEVARIGLAGIIDEELGSSEAAVFGVVRSANGYVDLLARNGVFGEENRIERAILALRDQGAVKEDAAIVREPDGEPYPRAADVTTTYSGGDLNGGAIPGVAVTGCGSRRSPAATG